MAKRSLTKCYVPDFSDTYRWVIKTPSASAKSFLCYVQETGLFECGTEYYTEHAGQASYLLILTLEGEGVLSLNEKEYRLLPGSLMFVDCMEWHSYKTVSCNVPWKILWLHFNGINVCGYFEQFAHQNTPVIQVGTSSKTEALMRKILGMGELENASIELLCSMHIIEILTEILFQSKVVFKMTNMPQFIQEAVRDIEEHFHDELSLEYFSQHYAVSRCHFLKEFKKYVGITPNEYIRRKRINNAKEMLKFSAMTVSEIGERVGISNISHFINLFKQTEGVTPLQYRLQQQKTEYNSKEELI